MKPHFLIIVETHPERASDTLCTIKAVGYTKLPRNPQEAAPVLPKMVQFLGAMGMSAPQVSQFLKQAVLDCVKKHEAEAAAAAVSGKIVAFPAPPRDLGAN